MALLHCHTATSLTYILHGGKFVFAHMGSAHFGSTAETALGFVSTGIAKMSRFIRHRATVLTSVCHHSHLFLRQVVTTELKTPIDIHFQLSPEINYLPGIVKSGGMQ